MQGSTGAPAPPLGSTPILQMPAAASPSAPGRGSSGSAYRPGSRGSRPGSRGQNRGSVVMPLTGDKSIAGGLGPALPSTEEVADNTSLALIAVVAVAAAAAAAVALALASAFALTHPHGTYNPLFPSLPSHLPPLCRRLGDGRLCRPHGAGVLGGRAQLAVEARGGGGTSKCGQGGESHAQGAHEEAGDCQVNECSK